jgi:hypothetical protein
MVSNARRKGAIMGVLSIVFPLSHQQEELVSWLHSLHLACPPGEGRYPTLEELRLVLDHLDGYTTRYSAGLSHWYAEVFPTDQVTSSDSASIVVNDYHNNDADPHEFCFERGSPHVMLLILQRLARLCGPLILLADTGALPVVVTADLNLDQTLQEWDSLTL